MSPACPPAVPDDHGAWSARDKYHRGWLACFTVKAGCIEHVRDDAGTIRLFPDKGAALQAALWAHIDRQNAPRKPVQDKAPRALRRNPKYLNTKARLRAEKHFRGRHGS